MLCTVLFSMTHLMLKVGPSENVYKMSITKNAIKIIKISLKKYQQYVEIFANF